METETPTPTPTPTETATATATFTPTNDYYIEATVEVTGQHARIAREMSIGDYWIIMILLAILISMWLMYIVTKVERR